MATRLLLVDDEESIRVFCRQVFEEAGYEVAVAAGGPAALAAIETSPPFDLFVIDLVMPEMPGDELARLIRLGNPDAKILYLTGYCDQLFDRKKMLWGDEAFIEKPASIAGLRESVSLLLFGHLKGPGGGAVEPSAS